MKCPGCGSEVDDGKSICPSCDHIIDDSFLSAVPAPVAEDEEESTNPGVPRSRPPPSRSGKKRPPRKKRAPLRGASSVEPPRPSPLVPPPPAPVPTRFVAEPGGRPVSYSPVFSPEETMQEARLFLGSLGTADKITLLGGALAMLCSFLPWKETAAEGELIGLQSLGAVATALMVLVMGAVVARARRSTRSGTAIAWLVQLACSGVTVVWCVVFIRLSSDPTPAPSVDGNVLVATSAPALGVYLGVVSGFLAVAGTLMGLKDNPA